MTLKSLAQWEDEQIGHQEHAAVDEVLCKKWIGHSIKELEQWVLNSGTKGSEYHPQSFPETSGAGGHRGKCMTLFLKLVMCLSAIERGVQGVRRIDQQRRALLNETKLTCMRLTLEMLR